MPEKSFTVKVQVTTRKSKRTRVVKVKAWSAEHAFSRVLDRYGERCWTVDRMDVVVKGRIAS